MADTIFKVIQELISQPNKQSFDQTYVYARDNKTKIDKESLIEYQVDIANLQVRLTEARKILSQANKEGNAQLQFNANIRVNEIQGALTQLKGEFNNLQNTGDATVSRLQAKFNTLGQSISGGATRIFQGLTSALGSLGISIGLGQLTKQMYDITTAATNAKNTFDKLFGSKYGDALLEQLKEISKNSPFSLDTLIDGTKRLAAFGFTGEQVIPVMQGIQTAVAGIGGDSGTFDRVALALGHIETTGKVTQRQLNSLANNGIPAIEILKEKLGLTADQVANIGKQGIGANVAIRALLEGINEKFGGLVEAKLNTAAGQLERLKNNFNLLLLSVGEKAQGPVVDFLKKISDFIEKSPQAASAIGGITVAIAGLAGVLALLGGPLTLLLAAMGSITAAYISISDAATANSINLDGNIQIMSKLTEKAQELHTEWEKGKISTKEYRAEQALLMKAYEDQKKVIEDVASKYDVDLVPAQTKAKAALDALNGAKMDLSTPVSELKRMAAAADEAYNSVLKVQNLELLQAAKKVSDLATEGVALSNEANTTFDPFFETSTKLIANQNAQEKAQAAYAKIKKDREDTLQIVKSINAEFDKNATKQKTTKNLFPDDPGQGGSTGSGKSAAQKYKELNDKLNAEGKKAFEKSQQDRDKIMSDYLKKQEAREEEKVLREEGLNAKSAARILAIKEAYQNRIDQINNKSAENQATAFTKLGDKLKEVYQSVADKISAAMDTAKDKMDSITSDLKDVNQQLLDRGVALAESLKKFDENQRNGTGASEEEQAQHRRDLEEQALLSKNVSASDLNAAIAAGPKSDTQKLLDKKTALQAEYKIEADEYNDLQEQKKRADADYAAAALGNIDQVRQGFKDFIEDYNSYIDTIQTASVRLASVLKSLPAGVSGANVSGQANNNAQTLQTINVTFTGNISSPADLTNVGDKIVKTIQDNNRGIKS